MNHLENAKRVYQSSKPDQFPDPGASLLGAGGRGGEALQNPLMGPGPQLQNQELHIWDLGNRKAEKAKDKLQVKIQGLSHRVLCGSELGAAPQALPWNLQGSELKMSGQKSHKRKLFEM